MLAVGVWRKYLQEAQAGNGFCKADLYQSVVELGAGRAFEGAADILSVCDGAQQDRPLGVYYLAVGLDGAAVLHALYKRLYDTLGVGIFAAVAGFGPVLVDGDGNGRIEAEVRDVDAVALADLEDVDLLGLAADEL